MLAALRPPPALLLPWLALGVLLGGCARDREARLLELDEVGPPLVTPGDRLILRGAGFPTGEHGRVTLSGSTHRPGQRPVRTQVTLSGRADATDRVVLTLEQPAFEGLRGPGTFAGQLLLAFDGSEPGTTVTGVLDVELDLRMPTAAVLRGRQGREADAERLLSFLGIVPDHGVPSQDGLVVDYALEDSRAAAAGLVHGDVIVRSAGVGIHALSDLAPPPGLDTLVLRVARPGRSTPVHIELPMAGLDAPRLAAHLVPLCVVACVVLLCLLLVGPLPSLSVWLARCRSRLSTAGRSPWVGIWDDRRIGPLQVPGADSEAAAPPSPLSRLRIAAWNLVLPLSVSALLFGVAYLQRALGLRFNSLPIYLGMTAVSVALSIMLCRDTAWRSRLRTGAGQLARMLVVGVSIGAASALGGTPALDGIVAAQGGMPMGWFVFSQPALFVAMPVFLVYASRIVPMEFGDGVLGHALSFVVDVGGRVVLSAIGAAVFFGGWQLAGIPQIDRVDPLLAGASLFTIKAWFVSMLLHACRTIGLGDHAPGWIGGCVAGASLALTAAWIVLAVPPGISIAVGHVLSTTTVVALLVAWLRVVRSDHPMGGTPSYPLATG